MKQLLVLALVAAVALAGTGVPVVTVCSSPTAILKDLQYSISPQNIVPGVNLTISVSGTLTQQVTQSTATISASFDGIPIYSNTLNICPDVHCPVAAGPFHYNVVHSIPNLPVSGTVVASATLNAQNNLQIACVQVSVSI